MVDEFLCFFFCELAFLDVLLDEDVEEGADTSDRHGCSVLVLDGSEVAEVYELHSLACVLCWASDIETVVGAHLHEALEGGNLLRCLFALLDALFCHLLDVETVEEALSLLYEVVYSIESDAAVVADDASASVCVWQTCDDVSMASSAYVLVVC